jgi:NAD(P)-dependent dehydrogenase (short-subunit alcohol dehydrogenase family)
MRLADKTVVVTGAGSGIGRATALAFAREGARVAACDVDHARLDELASELGDRALVVRKVDVADRAQMRELADAVHALVPQVDVLVNNAGVSVAAAFVDTTLEDWDWLLGVNLRGVIHGCHFFVPAMVKHGAGQVINMSSILGLVPSLNQSAYVASKFAVLGFSQTLRSELMPHKVGVTALCPGMIATSIVRDGRMSGALSGYRDGLVRRFSKGASPDLVAAAAIDAVRTNPAVRTVGRDAWTVHQLARIAPQTVQRVTNLLQRRLTTSFEARRVKPA